MPVPWIAGEAPTKQDWAAINIDRSTDVQELNLCLVCGLVLSKNFVFGLVAEKAIQNAHFYTWGHAKCILLAAVHCPHLRDNLYVAQDQHDVRLTLDDLRELVRSEKALHDV